jgi:tetratricopeptide (TPR) repeat protein
MGCRSACLPFLLSGLAVAEMRQPPKDWLRENAAAAGLMEQGRYADARSHYQTARSAAASLGPVNPLLAMTLNNLGTTCDYLGESLEAERYYRQSIRMWEIIGGSGSADSASALGNLATVYFRRGRYGDAIRLFERALEIPMDPANPRLVAIRNSLAVALTRDRQYVEAEKCLRRSLALAEQHLGPNTPPVAVALNHLAVIRREQGRPAEALPLLERAVSIWTAARGSATRGMIEPLNNLGAAHSDLGQYAEAAAELRRALEIAEQVLPPTSPDSAALMRNYAWALRKLKRKTEARRLEARAEQIRRLSDRENLGGYTIDIRSLDSFRPR